MLPCPWTLVPRIDQIQSPRSRYKENLVSVQLLSLVEFLLHRLELLLQVLNLGVIVVENLVGMLVCIQNTEWNINYNEPSSPSS